MTGLDLNMNQVFNIRNETFSVKTQDRKISNMQQAKMFKQEG